MRDYAAIYDRLLWDLEPFLRGSEPYISSDMDVKNAYSRALADSFYKKLSPLGDTTVADAAALEKFKRINDRIPDTPFEFPADNEAESCFWDYFKDNLNRTLGFDIGDRNFDLEFIRETMNVGPGAAQKANADTMVSKLFESDISYYGDDYLIALYRSALAETGLWAEAELLRSSKFRFVKVEGGKLFFAPKNAEISRTCCTEASLNMLIQKACGAFMEYRLEKHFGINLSTQPDFNRELARIGSVDGTFGTIDLVSASDSISWQLVLRSLEDGFLKAILSRSRSESAVLPDGSKVVLRMISTMGNGFTFPLQTVIFASAVRSVYQLMGLPCRCPRTQFAVFGDDIIVRREAFDFLSKMLVKLGFEVNLGKSFNTGPFRESCGTDWFRGFDIRGVYVRSLETPQAICSCINRLIRWSVRSGIMLPSTVGALRGLLSKERFVPRSLPDDAGMHVPFLLTHPSVDNSYWYRYRYYKKRIRKVVIPEVDDTSNPYGYGVGFLSGHIRRRDLSLTDQTIRSQPLGQELNDREPFGSLVGWSATASIRDRPGAKPRYKVCTSSIPYWDWPGLTHLSRSGPSSDTDEDYGSDRREPVSCDAWKSVAMAYLR